MELIWITHHRDAFLPQNVEPGLIGLVGLLQNLVNYYMHSHVSTTPLQVTAVIAKAHVKTVSGLDLPVG